MRLALVLLALALGGCASAPPTPFVKGPAHSFNGKAMAGAELSNRELANQRGTGLPAPHAQVLLPAYAAPTQFGFMY